MSESKIDFNKFLESFNDGQHKNNKYHDTIKEISRKHSGKKEPLIEHSFKMYSLDDIAKGSKALKYNLPKTADAIYFKDDGENSSLYLIEFKFHNLDDPDAEDLLEMVVDDFYGDSKKFKCVPNEYKKKLKKIRNYYGDDVKHSLILKPIESVRVVIPKLYKEFDSTLDDEEIEKYLDNINKRLVVFVSTYTDVGKANPEKEKMSTKKGSKTHSDILGSFLGDDTPKKLHSLANSSTVNSSFIHRTSFF